MKATKKLFLGAIDSSEPGIEGMFSTYLYTGTDTTHNIVNGIDLDGEGGMVWFKCGTLTVDHILWDTNMNPYDDLKHNTMAGITANGSPYGVVSANSDGFTLGNTNWPNINKVLNTYASWTFRNAFNFFQVLQVTKASGSNLVIDLPPYMDVPGMIKVKRTDAAGSWYVWHRSLTAGKLMIGETNAAEATLGHITVSGTTLTLVDGVLADGEYHIECYAHDDSAEGLIQCGSFVTGVSDDIDLGWEPQYILLKDTTASGNWFILDSMRGIVTNGNDSYLTADLTQAEASTSVLDLSATGFTQIGLGAGSHTYIYMAIRRPNKPPGSADEVFAIDAGDSGGTSAVSEFDSGFVVDMAIRKEKNAIASNYVGSRLTQSLKLITEGTDAWAADTNHLFDFMEGWYGAALDSDHISWMFKRAPSFFDVVCYTGTGVAGRTVSHNLGVVPEMIWIKNRVVPDAWAVYAGDETDYLVLNTTAATADLNTYWNDTAPTASVFTVGTVDNVNASTETYIAYLFATLPGISKVGSYTGDGTAGQTINCNFSSGASFILIKRTDDTGDWFFWDSVRGIIAGNDPHLSLNTTAAEVTTDDSIDPDNSGFIVNQVGATNVNVNTAEYIFYAIAAI